jgi:hypothetical protein
MRYLSKAHQQLNNLILTPKNGESRDFGPYSGQIPTFSNSQSYMHCEVSSTRACLREKVDGSMVLGQTVFVVMHGGYLVE